MCDIAHSPSNGFQAAPLPIAIRPNRLAPDVFSPSALPGHIQRNARWIRARPRTTNQIHVALFRDYDLAGMVREEVIACLNAALEDEGYTPSDHSENPTWT